MQGLSWRQTIVVPALIAAGMLGLCAALCLMLEVPVRNPKSDYPEHLLQLGKVFAGAIVLQGFWCVARRRSFAHLWSVQRAMWAVFALAAFEATYVAYRNLKGWVPLARTEHYDPQLAAFDRMLFGGAGASERISSWIGHGIAARVIDMVYMSYLPLVSITVVLALALMPSLRQQAAFVTATLGNWTLGALTYWTLPAVGPAFTHPDRFAWMHHAASGSARLQESLAAKRIDALAGDGVLQSIGAFPSLHTSVTITWALMLCMLGYRKLGILAWIYCAITVTATLYLGWHYSLDLLAGAVIATASCIAARRLFLSTAAAARTPVPKWRLARAAAALIATSIPKR
jgi:membrane-associated phospholipid phosphatase